MEVYVYRDAFQALGIEIQYEYKMTICKGVSKTFLCLYR